MSDQERIDEQRREVKQRAERSVDWTATVVILPPESQQAQVASMRGSEDGDDGR